MLQPGAAPGWTEFSSGLFLVKKKKNADTTLEVTKEKLITHQSISQGKYALPSTMRAVLNHPWLDILEETGVLECESWWHRIIHPIINSVYFIGNHTIYCLVR